MKRNLLLGLVLASAIGTQNFAMEITHGKLLSQKEWTTGKVTGSFKEVTAKDSKYAFLREKMNNICGLFFKC